MKLVIDYREKKLIGLINSIKTMNIKFKPIEVIVENLPLSDVIIKDNKDNEWQVIDLPLICLDDANFNISSITSRANLGTEGDWIVDIHSVKYINNKGYTACKLNSANYE